MTNQLNLISVYAVNLISFYFLMYTLDANEKQKLKV